MPFGIFGLQYCHITFISVPVLIAWLTVAVVPRDNFTNVEFTMYSSSLYYMRPNILVEEGANMSSHSTLLRAPTKGKRCIMLLLASLEVSSIISLCLAFYMRFQTPGVECDVMINIIIYLFPECLNLSKTHQNPLRSFEDLIKDKYRQRKVTVFLYW